MGITSSTELLRELEGQHLLKPLQLQELTARGGTREPKALAQDLVRRGWLTEFQAKLLLQGRGRELVLGPFHLLDQLGEGGMGQVFKARHHELQRVVALKILKTELIHDAEAVARFYREIKLASQLKPHPHLVQVHDAGPLGATHFLAMEYVEGIDLDRLVAQAGQLPVAQACDYVRQAALGLQHAHEHGLVHRDVKPGNLMRASAHGAQSAVLVKVLDLGLARLQRTSGNSGNSLAATLTANGTMTLGTVDYMAPEQALDFHRADIRADIYSLGCVLHYLLTGKPPFGSGPLAIKLMRHQQAEPPNLHELRPEVSAELARIAQKMLAKRPADRYQTPAEVATALDRLARTTSTSGSFISAVYRTTRYTLKLATLIIRRTVRAARHHPRLLIGGVSGLLLLGLLFWFVPADLYRAGANRSDRKTSHSTSPELLMQGPSPLDQLDPARVKGRQPGWPNEVVAVMTGYRMAESYLRFSPDGRLLVSCGDNTTPFPLIWNLAGAEPKVLTRCEGHRGNISNVAFSPDGKLLAATDYDPHVKVWDLTAAPPKERHVLKGLSAPLAFAPDSYRLAGRDLVTKSAVRVLDLSGPEPKDQAVISVSGGVGALAFARDGKTLATGDGATTVKLWDLSRPEPTARLVAGLGPQWSTGVRCLALTADAQSVAAGSNYGFLRLWNLSGPEPKERLNTHPVADSGPVIQVAFSGDGKILASAWGKGLLILWEVATGQKLREWKLAGIHSMDLAPDGRHLAIGVSPVGHAVYILRLGPEVLDANTRNNLSQDKK